VAEMKKAGLFVMVVLWVIRLSSGKCYADLDWVNLSREILDVRTVLVNENDDSLIYIGTGRAVFKSQDSGNSWRIVLEDKRVNFFSFAPDHKEAIYALTNDGLWYSVNQGGNWRVIFKGKSSAEKDCRAIAVLADRILLGTAGGLFISLDKGRSWHKTGGKLDDIKILAITYSQKYPRIIYVASVEGVYKTTDTGNSWSRVYAVHATENGDEIDDGRDDTDEPERFSAIRYISVNPQNSSNVFLATGYGLYQSENGALSWSAVSDYGLLSRDAHFLYTSSAGRLYAATKGTIFEFDGRRWHELSFELAVNEIRFIGLDEKNNLYVASDLGLFKANINATKRSGLSSGDIREFHGRNEPNIASVQNAAIKYAEVSPEKIKNWRRQAALKACLPQVNVGINRDTGDLWHWESGSSTKVGDDALIKGNDSLGWDLSLKWDLAELVFNDLQTSIDVRSRLMVQLRDDVLDEVTKLYFERIRVRMELENLSIEDRKRRSEKELKMAELTAQIDALTGGYFSGQLEKKH